MKNVSTLPIITYTIWTYAIGGIECEDPYRTKRGYSLENRQKVRREF
jgi:hypothetical protein